MFSTIFIYFYSRDDTATGLRNSKGGSIVKIYFQDQSLALTLVGMTQNRITDKSFASRLEIIA